MTTIEELVQDSHERARRKGWWDEQTSLAENTRDEYLDRELVEAVIPEKLALIHSEVSEALECYRDGELGASERLCCDLAINGPHRSGCPQTGKPEGFPSELADIVIRVCDLAGALGIDLQGAIQRKAAYNETRQIRHGGKKC